MELLPAFEVSLRHDGVEFTRRDVELLEAIDEYGSIHRAAGELGRSYSRAQQRIVTLESAFGDLVERTRGGPSGGGSSVTDRGWTLRNRFERLRIEVGGVAETAETVLRGRVHDRDGDLATVETAAGSVLAVVPLDADDVRLILRADAVTLHAADESPAPDATSARNTLRGTVTEAATDGAVRRVAVDVGAGVDLTAIVTRSSVERLGLEPGVPVVASFKATATRSVPVEEPD